jgi:hypothetical protein
LKIGVEVSKPTVVDHGCRPQKMQLTFCHRGHCNRLSLTCEGDRDLVGRFAAAVTVICPDLAIVAADLPRKDTSSGFAKRDICLWDTPHL